MFTKYSNIVWQLKTEIIPIQLSMFTKYSNIVWQLKTEIILNCKCLLNTIDNVYYWILQYCMTIEDNWQCLLNTPILYDNWRQKLYCTIVNVTEYSNIVWQLKTEIILVQLSMFTKYSNIVWQLKTEIIPIQLSMFTKYSNIVWQLKSAIYSYNCQCLLNTPILYDNWRQKLYSCTIDNVY